MLQTAQSATRRGIVRGLATLCRVLDDIPSLGRSYERSEPASRADSATDGDDLVISAGGVVVFPRGGWGSRFTTLMYLSAELDERWGTQVRPVPEQRAVQEEPADQRSARHLRAV